MLHLVRFKKNNFYTVRVGYVVFCLRVYDYACAQEKNPTIVNFPVKNLEMRDYLMAPQQVQVTKYDLVANICHDSVHSHTDTSGGSALDAHDSGAYRVHVQSKASALLSAMQSLLR
jgi:U4/U6.U5 tri-snRNP-associated protein 2